MKATFEQVWLPFFSSPAPSVPDDHPRTPEPPSVGCTSTLSSRYWWGLAGASGGDLGRATRPRSQVQGILEEQPPC